MSTRKVRVAPEAEQANGDTFFIVPLTPAVHQAMNPFDPSFSDSGMLVYHYTKMETAQKHIFQHKRLRFEDLRDK